MSFPLSVITPYGEIFNDQVESVTAPGQLGQFQVLTQHAPILYALKSGSIDIGLNGGHKRFAVTEGVLEVNSQHQCLILAESCNPVS